MQNTSQLMDRRTIMPFLWTAVIWLIAGIGVSARFHGTGVVYALGAFGLLWGLCMLDLYALSRAAGAVLQIASESDENRGVHKIQAFYWGSIKLACLGTLGLVLFYGRTMPQASLLLGTGTLVIVPLVGGYWWSQKVLSHA